MQSWPERHNDITTPEIAPGSGGVRRIAEFGLYGAYGSRFRINEAGVFYVMVCCLLSEAWLFIVLWCWYWTCLRKVHGPLRPSGMVAWYAAGCIPFTVVLLGLAAMAWHIMDIAAGHVTGWSWCGTCNRAMQSFTRVVTSDFKTQIILSATVVYAVIFAYRQIALGRALRAMLSAVRSAPMDAIGRPAVVVLSSPRNEPTASTH